MRFVAGIIVWTLRVLGGVVFALMVLGAAIQAHEAWEKDGVAPFVGFAIFVGLVAGGSFLYEWARRRRDMP